MDMNPSQNPQQDKEALTFEAWFTKFVLESRWYRLCRFVPEEKRELKHAAESAWKARDAEIKSLREQLEKAQGGWYGKPGWVLSMEDQFAQAQAKISALKEALRIRKQFMRCPECKSDLNDGFNHAKSCKYYEADTADTSMKG